MTRKLPFILLFCSLFAAPFHSFAQQEPLSEMRGAWIASVVNIDWPSAPGLSSHRQQMEFDSLLDVLRAMGFNSVFVQIRPAGDALYETKLAPWSKYLTGQQGKSPEPYYDPLEYMIESAHQRRMEFHAWLNPYRATFDADTAALAPTHPIRSLPKDRLWEWVFQYGNKYYFNPASPFVRRYLVNIVHDIVLRYNIDGIHFDDYFYPYPEAGQQLNDYDFFASDPQGFTNIEDWRRNNINMLIRDVSTEIKSLKPYVKFGVSPFGVYRNQENAPNVGSATRAGFTCYDDLYADVLLWLRNNWIDYVAPQSYWSIGYPPADYQVLAEWWARNSYGKHVYMGHAAYKIGNSANDPNWNQPNQIQNQIRVNRLNPRIQGSIYFSARPLLRNPFGIQDSLIQSEYRYQALLPSMPWMSPTPPANAQICAIEGTETAIRLAWHACEVLTGDEMPYYFLVYRFNGEHVGELGDVENVLTMTSYNPKKWTFEDQSVAEGGYYTYLVQPYNRFHIAGQASVPITVKKTKKGMKKKRKLFGLYF
jgi:uncharacterized lipoprotein YddW (UPF0748 family)